MLLFYVFDKYHSHPSSFLLGQSVHGKCCTADTAYLQRCRDHAQDNQRQQLVTIGERPSIGDTITALP